MRKQNQAFYEFLVPLVKGFSTEMSIEVASLGVQVHGGMGFIEETGAAQYLRDARILTIYEGTTAIQANDLVGRKTARDGGAIAKAHGAAQIEATEARARARATARRRRRCSKRLTAPRARPSCEVVDFVVAQGKVEPERGVRRLGALPDARRATWSPAGRWRARCWSAERTLAAGEGCRIHAQPRSPTARFYAEHLLSRVPGHARRHRRRRGERHRAGAGRVLSPASPSLTESLMPLPPVLRNLPLPDHRRAAVHRQQPQARHRAVHRRHRRLDAGAERAARRAARRMAGRDHRDAGRATTARTPIGRRRRSRSTRSCTRATTGSSTTCRCARSTRCRSSSPRSARAPTSTTRCTAGAASCCTTSSTTPSRRKAIEKGADGLIAVAAGAGGHAGVKSPFALVQEIREWFDGPLALSGAIATGGAVLAAQAMGADFAYIGSAFIATDEARAADAYKQMIVECTQRRHRLLEPVHRRARQLPEAARSATPAWTPTACRRATRAR